jgi:hypothetical protein
MPNRIKPCRNIPGDFMASSFHVGQTVYLRPLRGRDAAVGGYEIRTLMPEEGGQARYRIKSLIETHERVVSEQELTGLIQP